MSRQVRIDRCVCFDRPFAEIRAAIVAEPAVFGCDDNGCAAQGAAVADHSLDQIGRRFGCGSCCGVCRPYLERMLETGETVFHQVILPGRGLAPDRGQKA